MLTATGLKRSDLGTHGRKLVRCGGKQVLVIAQQDRLFAIPIAARTRAIR